MEPAKPIFVNPFAQPFQVNNTQRPVVACRSVTCRNVGDITCLTHQVRPRRPNAEVSDNLKCDVAGAVRVSLGLDIVKPKFAFDIHRLEIYV